MAEKRLSDFVDIAMKPEEIGDFSVLWAFLSETTWSVLIALSGGPDSLFVLLCVFFLLEKKGESDRLCVVHCNHKTRKETDREESFVRSFCSAVSFVSFSYEGHDFSERALRTWRWGCLAEMYREKKACCVLTGHHLSDRVETSLMHLARGCGFLGLWNMMLEDQKAEMRVFRPLLSLTKKEILSFCDRVSLPYLLDPSNDNCEISQRNLIRKILSESSVDSVADLFVPLYAVLDSYKKRVLWLVTLEKRAVSSLREGVTAVYEAKIKTQDRTIDLLILVLQQLWRYRNASWWQLFELLAFLEKWKSGYKYYRDLCVFVCHGSFYFALWPDCFWKRESLLFLDDKKIEEEKEKYLIYGELSLKFEAMMLWWVMMLAPEKARMDWKSLSKRFARAGVPFFLRPLVPCLIKEDVILKSYDKEVMTWFLIW